MTTENVPFAAPALPIAPVEYQASFLNQNNNILRLFFNKLVGLMRDLIYGLRVYGVFCSTVDQTNPVGGSENLVTFNTTVAGNAILVGGTTSQIHVQRSGIFSFAVSLQLDKTGGAAAAVFVWFKKNGTAVANSARKATIASSTTEVSVSWTQGLDLLAGDYVEVAWSSSDTAVTLEYTADSSPVAAIPSAMLTVTYVSPPLRAG